MSNYYLSRSTIRNRHHFDNSQNFKNNKDFIETSRIKSNYFEKRQILRCTLDTIRILISSRLSSQQISTFTVQRAWDHQSKYNHLGGDDLFSDCYQLPAVQKKIRTLKLEEPTHSKYKSYSCKLIQNQL